MIFIWSKWIWGMLESGVEFIRSGGTMVTMMDLEESSLVLQMWLWISGMEEMGTSSIAMM